MNDGMGPRYRSALASLARLTNGTGITIRLLVGTAINFAGATVLLADVVQRWPS